MAAGEDMEFTSPHNQGTCQTLVGDLDTQGDRRNPRATGQDVRRVRGEEEWRPDGTRTREKQLGGGRGSHAWRDPEGLGGSGGVHLVFPLPSRPREACGAPGPGPPTSEAPSGLRWSQGHRREVGGRRGEAGGRGPSGRRIRGGVEGVSPAHSGPRKPAGLPGQFSILPGPLQTPGSYEHGREGEGGKRRGGCGSGGGGTLQDRRIREGMAGIPPMHQVPGTLLGFRVQSTAFWGPSPATWVLGAQEGMGSGEKERPMERGPAGQEDQGGVPSVSSTHLGPMSLLGSWTWSSSLQGQRHSCCNELKPHPHPYQGLIHPCGY